MMNSHIIIPIIAIMSGLLCIVLAALLMRQRKGISDLADSINDYIQNGKAIDFSVRDNEFARLHNSVSDMQNLIEQERVNTANEIKKNTDFIADVSHQLKTPIAGLRLYCEMEAAEHPNDHIAKELQLIERMENLVQSLLRLEKIRSDSYTMDYDPARMEDIVSAALCELVPLFPGKRYNVNGSSTLRCDSAWITEAVGNIIKNASEHTAPDGRVDITIIDNPGSTIVEIQDNGGGIKAEELPGLFTRFFRTENAVPTSTGIGLAITKAIVDKHHGIINAENKGDGLCVSICLPHLDGCVTI